MQNSTACLCLDQNASIGASQAAPSNGAERALLERWNETPLNLLIGSAQYQCNDYSHRRLPLPSTGDCSVPLHSADGHTSTNRLTSVSPEAGLLLA